jgi:AcrR family transcriptional regulator
MERKRLASRTRAPEREREPEPVPRRVGRPRSEEADAAILDATIDLVREVGYDAVAMEAVAARAGVGKATLYRRWSAKETLVADAIARIVRAVPMPDTGTAEGDLLALMRTAMRMYADPATADLLSGLVAAMARSERIARAVRGGFVASFRGALRTAVERGIARGQIARGADVELVLDLLSGPPLHRFLIAGARIDDRLVRGVVSAVLRAFAPGT